nr:Trigger factor like [Ipomoea batatas]
MMVELFLLGCTGIVVFLHGANFFFHALTHQVAIRSLRFSFFSRPSLHHRSAKMTKRTKKASIVVKYGTRYGASLRKQIKKMEGMKNKVIQKMTTREGNYLDEKEEGKLLG